MIDTPFSSRNAREREWGVKRALSAPIFAGRLQRWRRNSMTQRRTSASEVDEVVEVKQYLEEQSMTRKKYFCQPAKLLNGPAKSHIVNLPGSIEICSPSSSFFEQGWLLRRQIKAPTSFFFALGEPTLLSSDRKNASRRRVDGTLQRRRR